VQLNVEELFVIIVIAAVVIGPSRIPKYAEQLGRLVRTLRDMARGATKTLKEELGPEAEDLDFTKLDPRQYDPRRIVRDALMEDDAPARTRSSSSSPGGSGSSNGSGSSSSTGGSGSSGSTGAAAGAAAAAGGAAAGGAAAVAGSDSAAEAGQAEPAEAEDADPLAGGAPFDDEAT